MHNILYFNSKRLLHIDIKFFKIQVKFRATKDNIRGAIVLHNRLFHKHIRARLEPSFQAFNHDPLTVCHCGFAASGLSSGVRHENDMYMPLLWELKDSEMRS
jgi:hypothetical protein